MSAFIDLADRGKRVYLAKKFLDILVKDKRFRVMGNTLQALGIDTIQYYFKHSDVEYVVREEKNEKNEPYKMMKFKFKFPISIEKFELEFDISEADLARGHL